MKTSQRFLYYFTAAILVALVIVSVYAGGKRQPPQDSTADASRVRSYEEIVGDQQKRWGHGHTLGDPAPGSEGPGAR